MKPKTLSQLLSAALLAMMVGARARIAFEAKTAHGFGQVLAVVGISLVVVLVLIHALDLLPEFLSIFNIQFP